MTTPAARLRTGFSPAASYHAQLCQELEAFGRVLAVQRVLSWASRGLAAGMALDLAFVAWAWYRESPWSTPGVLLLVAPLGLAMALGAATLLRRSPRPELARRVDAAARLQERSVTALELSAHGAEHPLALAQMRDTLEHLQRVDALSAFPLRAPRAELVISGLLLLLGLAIVFAPNPWALARARANNPATAVARDQAQRVERLADALQAESLAEIQELRDVLKRGARTVETRSSVPEDSLASLEDLEERIRQMSAGDDQLASALAAIAGALAGEQSTSQLAQAINTGDLREVARASRSLAQSAEQLSGPERERVARALQDAANRAGRSSPQLQEQLSDAAGALRQGAAAGGQASGADAQPGAGSRSAQEALEDMAGSATGAAERQRALGQLESSRNALERALGRGQSRAGSSPSNSRGGSRAERGQRGMADDAGAAGDSAEQGGESESGGGDGEGGGEGQQGPGSGFGSGSQGDRLGGGVSDLDAVTRPELLGASGGFAPDETSDNPFLAESSDGASRLGDESVAPGGFARKSTQGGDGASIPLGLRDLVKDYFSSLDQR